MVNMLHYDNVRADACATTIAVPETIGTTTLLPETSDVPAFILQSANTGTSTTAQAQSISFLVNARALAPEILYIPACIGTGGLPATNEGATFDNGKFFPFRPRDGKLGNARITFQAQVNDPDPTGDFAAQATTLFTVGSANEYLRNRGLAMSGALQTRCSWADRSILEDLGATLADAFPNDVTIPHWVSRVCAYGVMYNQDAVLTAGEHVLGDVTLTGTLQGLDPMKLPLPAVHAGLGTTVDAPLQFGEQIHPMYLECPNADVDITFTANIQQALSGTDQVVSSLYGF